MVAAPVDRRVGDVQVLLVEAQELRDEVLDLRVSGFGPKLMIGPIKVLEVMVYKMTLAYLVLGRHVSLKRASGKAAILLLENVGIMLYLMSVLASAHMKQKTHRAGLLWDKQMPMFLILDGGFRGGVSDSEHRGNSPTLVSNWLSGLKRHLSPKIWVPRSRHL